MMNKLSDIKAANAAYNLAKRDNMGVRRAQDRLFNVLFNCRQDLISLIEDNGESASAAYVAELESKIQKLEADKASLMQALQEADEQNEKLRSAGRSARKKATKVEDTAD